MNSKFQPTWVVVLSLAHGSMVPSLAQTPKEACLTQIDSQHACACQDIRGESSVDAGAFDLARPDINGVYQALQANPGFQPEALPRLTESLKKSYNEHRELLSCHDRVAVRIADYYVAEDYCVHEPESARAFNRPVCKEAGSREQNEAKQKVQLQIEKTLGSLDRQLERLSYCDYNQVQAKTWMRGIAVQYPPCKIDLKSLFPNNISTLTPAQTQQLTQYIQSHECYQRALKDELILEKIEIKSSSSRLANTGVAAQKSFLTLSQERALEMENKLVRPLFSSAISTAAIKSVKFEVSYQGANGDGTSGACPYAYDSQKRTWFRKSFPTSEQLESNKRTELNLYFSERSQPIEAPYRTSMMMAPCKRAVFYCR
jgi:hypothetical protein